MDKEKRNLELEQLLKEELRLIRKKPGKNHKRKENLVGLAFSGGGIRSASFATGVLHALVGKDRLKEIDYLSTVSGGGYIGSALSWFLHLNRQKGEKILSPKGFPLGQKGEGSETGDNNNALNYIRQHASYLCPGKGLNLVSCIACILRGTIVGMLVYFPLMAFFLWLLKPWSLSKHYSKLSLGLVALFALSSVLYALFTCLQTCFSKNGSSTVRNFDYLFRISVQRWQGGCLCGALFFLLLWSLEPVMGWLMSHGFSGTVAAVSTCAGYFGIACQFFRERFAKSSGSSLVLDGLGIIVSALFIYGFFLLSYAVAAFYTPFLWPLLAIGGLIGLLTNLNLIGLHRTYRDRLMETFMPDPQTAANETWAPARAANNTLLTDLEEKPMPGPYHLYSCTTVLVDSTDPKFRGRGGDSFILSPLYCGSYATGWQKTEEFMKGTMNPATAMAISAAAVNPSAGVAGEGVTRLPLVSFLMTFFNLRLGYWAPNPQRTLIAKKGWRPNFFSPGLQDLLACRYSEKNAFLELTDGGHFENLGVYELIRRKVKILIVSDGGGDPEITFADLGNAIERVRVDFGVIIDFPDSEYDLEWLKNGSGGEGVFQAGYQMARRGFAIGTIRYPEDGEQPSGKIFYVKPVMTEQLPVDVYAYKSANPRFPHETTANQFFNERQFEAYRELGYRLTLDLLEVLQEDWELASS